MSSIPSEVWGFRPDDRVEVRVLDGSARTSAIWHMGTVKRITPSRLPMVLLDNGKSIEVKRPGLIRFWKPPKTAADIDAFLNGG